MKYAMILIILIFSLLILGCGTDENGVTDNTKQDTNNDDNVDLVNEKPDVPVLNEGDDEMKEVVVLETTKGNIEIQLNRMAAPETVENFVSYVKAGHYDGTVFHRVISNFMVQGGGFTADGKQKKTNAPIKLESNNGLKNKKGSVAMARTNVPDSATSQFFINVVDNDFLNYAQGNPGYAVFGKVTSGMEVVEAIKVMNTQVKYGMADWPKEDITITKAYMKE